MNYYLKKYVGTYRVKADIDLMTNDFCRDRKGELNNNSDIYIKCANGIKIFHYGKGILDVYIPSITKGKNILRQYCYENNIGNIRIEETTIVDKNGKEKVRVSYKHECSFEELLSKIMSDGILFDYYDTNEEVGFKIKDKDLDKIINILNPQTSGASISPLSPKNLTKKKYEYTTNQIDKYNEVTSPIPKEDKLLIGRINNEFLNKVLKKKLKMKVEDIKVDIKKEQLKLKDYIYYKGYENEYLEFLKKSIGEVR